MLKNFLILPHSATWKGSSSFPTLLTEKTVAQCHTTQVNPNIWALPKEAHFI